MMSSSDSLATPQTGQSSSRHIPPSTPASSIASPNSAFPRNPFNRGPGAQHVSFLPDPTRIRGISTTPPGSPRPSIGGPSRSRSRSPSPGPVMTALAKAAAAKAKAAAAASSSASASAADVDALAIIAANAGAAGTKTSTDLIPRTFSSSIIQEEARLRWDAEAELSNISRTVLFLQKVLLVAGLVAVNALLIGVGGRYSMLFVLFTILLSSNTMLQGFMIVCLIVHKIFTTIRDLIFGVTVNVPDKPERMVWLLPCYNESPEEVTRSIDSLVAQIKLDEHPKCMFIVVDGDVKGPGMDKTTQDYLFEDILEPGTRQYFENGYRARDGLYMPVRIMTGVHKGLPYILVGKRHNQGKRDSLCFARSFVWHYTARTADETELMYSPELFDYMGNAMMSFGLDGVDQMAGMDADTVFAPDCIYEMLIELRKSDKRVGVCGHVCVDFGDKPFDFWSLYQSVEYSQTQGLRRMFQSRITGKVNCLPGCCQLLRVSEATFGDEVLRERFGYCPKPNDNMTSQIMGNYSEDSIHASIIFSLHPGSETAQALKAKAYTTVPRCWPVFLSQRKRWALGSISNEFCMVFRKGIIPIERLQSVVATVTWAITPFIISALVQLIMLLVERGRDMFNEPAFIGLISVLWLRYTYSFCIIFWLPRTNLERLQYFIGFWIHMVVSPFMNLVVLVYCLLYSDDFKWGKTRVVVDDEDEDGDGTDERWRPPCTCHDTRPGRQRSAWGDAQRDREKEKEKEKGEIDPLNGDDPEREKEEQEDLEEAAPFTDNEDEKGKGKGKGKEREEVEEDEKEKVSPSPEMEGSNDLALVLMPTRIPIPMERALAA